MGVFGLQVKPGLPYLDIIRLLRDKSPLPIAAYQVSTILIFTNNTISQSLSFSFWLSLIPFHDGSSGVWGVLDDQSRGSPEDDR